jgi:hypothetical protein
MLWVPLLLLTAAAATTTATAVAAARASRAAAAAAAGGAPRAAMSHGQRAELRERTREFFHHGFSAYKEHAYPWDELRPLSCDGRRWDRRERGTLDDALGGYATTLVDSLSTMVTMGELALFRRGVDLVLRDVRFDRDVVVSVFETVIRVLGGLLSAHQLMLELGNSHGDGGAAAANSSFPFRGGEGAWAAPQVLAAAGREGDEADWLAEADWLRASRLLSLAEDLGARLLPAFDTPTGIPAHRVHLQRGLRPIAPPEHETCPAAAGTLLLEFGALSLLTRNGTYERVARRATRALWRKRSELDLVGATIDTQTGQWRQTHSGIGAGIDSFYEYLLKGHVLYGCDDAEWLGMFERGYAATAKQLRVRSDETGLEWHVEVAMEQGAAAVHTRYVSSLSAFWPALQVLAGDTAAAARTFASYWSVWLKFRALPEIYDLSSGQPVSYAKDWPLRPELAESAYHLYRATQDPFYLRAGEAMLDFIGNATRTECGFAAVADVTTTTKQGSGGGKAHGKPRLDDRMDSFFFSETLKYLYLLFQEGGVLSAACAAAGPGASANLCAGDDSVLFTTEGHVLLLTQQLLRQRLQTAHVRKASNEAAGRIVKRFTCPNFVTIAKKDQKKCGKGGRKRAGGGQQGDDGGGDGAGHCS